MAFLDDIVTLKEACTTDEHLKALDNIFVFAEGLSDEIKSQQERITEYEQFTFDRGGDMGELLKRLRELEEDCPDCGGKGWTHDDSGMTAGEQCVNLSCVNGKAPISYLPDEFMDCFYSDDDDWQVYTVRKDGIQNLRFRMYDEKEDDYIEKEFNFSKQPNNLWKLEKHDTTEVSK